MTSGKNIIWKAIARKTISHMLGTGTRVVYLQVSDKNHVAMQLYRNLGFRVVDYSYRYLANRNIIRKDLADMKS